MLPSTKKALDEEFDVAATADETPAAVDMEFVTEEQENALMPLDDEDEDDDQIEPVIPRLGVHVQADFDKTRQNLQNLLKQGESALLGLIGLASNGEDPKAYEAVAKLMKEIRETNKDLVGLHQQVLDMLEQQTELIKQQKRNDQQPLGPSSGAPVVNNAVIFTGSAKELLDQINKTRR